VDPEARTLRIAAETGATKTDDYDAGGGVRVHLSERSSGSATRTLRLPPTVDVDAIGSANVVRPCTAGRRARKEQPRVYQGRKR
jgi:hypothetical protein